MKVKFILLSVTYGKQISVLNVFSFQFHLVFHSGTGRRLLIKGRGRLSARCALYEVLGEGGSGRTSWASCVLVCFQLFAAVGWSSSSCPHTHGDRLGSTQLSFAFLPCSQVKAKMLKE